MSKTDDIFKKIQKDIKVKLSDEFDRNFERKAFFDQTWAESKAPNRRGSLMMRTGSLRSSVNAELIPEGVKWSSSKPYANIHNEGGKIKVTEQMKKYFWAMYYKASGGITYSAKTKKANKTQRNRDLSTEAAYWKSLALKKVGTMLTIPERRFIGFSPQVENIVNEILHHHLGDLEKYVYNLLNAKN